MTEILSEVWNGVLIGFRYMGIGVGFIIGAYLALILAFETWDIFNPLDHKLGRKEKES